MQNKPLQGWLRNTAIVAALAVPLAALAQQQAFTSNAVNLRAGPGTEYPVVAVLAQGQSLDVVGCTDGYGWCDVSLPDGMRGWISASLLSYPYQGSAVPLVTYGAAIGVPLVSFAIGSYWGSYYRDRPWYNEPRWWGGHRPPPPRPGWRPPPPPHPGWAPRPPPPGWHGRPDYGRPDYVQRPGRPPDYGRPDHGRPPGYGGGGRPDGRPPGHGGRPEGRPDHGGGRPNMGPPGQGRPPPQQARPSGPPQQSMPGGASHGLGRPGGFAPAAGSQAPNNP